MNRPPQVQTNTDQAQRRRASACVMPSSDCAQSLLDLAKRRGSSVSVGSDNNCQQQYLAVPDLKQRRASLSTSTSALLGLAQPSVANRKRGSTGSGLLSVPFLDAEGVRRRSLPGYMLDEKGSLSNHVSAHHQPADVPAPPTPVFDRRRSSVLPDEVYRQINDDGTRKTKLFGIVLIFVLAAVIALSFLKLFR